MREKRYRYFSPYRPVSIGTFPNTPDNPAVYVCNFDFRDYVKQIGMPAYGYVEYKYPLDEDCAYQNELVLGRE